MLSHICFYFIEKCKPNILKATLFITKLVNDYDPHPLSLQKIEHSRNTSRLNTYTLFYLCSRRDKCQLLLDPHNAVRIWLVQVYLREVLRLCLS